MFFSSDQQFNTLYPAGVRAQASMHWTPLHIARKAAGFLAATPGSRILDIGSGGGKFCLAGAYYRPDAFFTGVEQRMELVEVAEQAAGILRLPNVSFLHADITDVAFKDHDHFYFFNAFFENIDSSYRIDERMDYSPERYHSCNRYMYRQLEQKPAGTRLVTFHSTEDERPPSYHEVDASEDALLKCWIKV